MKKLILTLTIAAFACASASFADEAKKECTASKKQCTLSTGAKMSCCAGKKAGTCTSEGVSKQALLTPKAKQ